MIGFIQKAICIVSVLVFANLSYAKTYNLTYHKSESVQKEKCSDKPFKVAIFNSGSDKNNTQELINTINALRDKGLLNLKVPLDQDYDIKDKKNFSLFVKASAGGCIEFLEDGFYDGHWEHDTNKKNANILRKRAKDGDFNFLLAIGMGAIHEFADGSLDLPVSIIGLSVGGTDAFVKSGEYSGVKGVHVQKYYKILESEFVNFYNFFKPEKVGLVVDNDPVKRASFGYPAIKNLSKKIGFELITCSTEFDTKDREYNITNYSNCLIELAHAGVDAVTFANNPGVDKRRFFSQIKPLIDSDIPVFIRGNSELVKKGALMSMSVADDSEIGRFNAAVIEKIYKGGEPSEISQYYYTPLIMSVNLRTAYLIGWKPSFEFLTAVDEVYKNIDYGEASGN